MMHAAKSVTFKITLETSDTNTPAQMELDTGAAVYVISVEYIVFECPLA